MVLSPTKDSRSTRSNLKADKPQAYYKEWMSLDCFQENMDTGNGFAKTKLDPKPDGSTGESVLQSSDLPNRQRAAPASNKGSFCGLSRCDSAEIEPVSCPGSPGESERGNFKKETGPGDDVNRKKESDVFELPGVPDSNGTTNRSAQVGDNCSEHSKEDGKEEYGEREERVTDTVEETDKDMAADSTQDSSRAPSAKEEIDNSQELNHKPEEMDKCEEPNQKTCSPNKDPEDSTTNNRLDHAPSRRKERIVPEEKLGTSCDFDNGEAPLPFSGALSLSGAVPYSGPIPFSGSISRRSDGSSASTRSFAFPILPFEWNASPVRMPPPDRRWRRKRNWWCLRCICCSQPSTHP